ncbi:phage protease [uncultured Helicobacter sp.]|uniref:phage protease n=1 Tax=uncultured Helicobacter sp. TaxID=175537 RepID=UPI00260231B7|nr:phage protease [uncultured Helicobacter sp.]
MKDVVFLELQSAQAQKDTKEKVKISPCGSFSGIDGREFSLNAALVLERLKLKGCDIMLDKDHQDKEALGWFPLDSFEAREDGIYADLELNSIGKSLVEDKVYRYISPAYLKNAQGEVVDIVSIGLVNRPNLSSLTALNNEQTLQGERMNEQAKALQDELAKAKEENKALEARIKALEAQIQEAQEQKEKRNKSKKKSLSMKRLKTPLCSLRVKKLHLR